MKKVLLLMALCILVLSDCKKKAINYPIFTLQYQSSKGNYSQTETENVVNSNFPLIAWANTTLSGSPSADSITMIYSSILRAANDQPFIQISIYHTYAKSQLDSIAFGQWVPKNENDFYNIFSGSFSINNFPNNSFSGVALTLNPGGDTVFYAFPNNYNDTANHFEVTATGSYMLDWYYLMENFCGQPSCVYTPILVSASFSGRLTNLNPPYDTLVVTNGYYQGVFVDRY
jgi:hypothetical protein